MNMGYEQYQYWSGLEKVATMCLGSCKVLRTQTRGGTLNPPLIYNPFLKSGTAKNKSSHVPEMMLFR